ncbi:hypothetical protein N7474_003370 [Penicillium riverlandense]|uniref:uncharacterized protein n=1 Tax=Penicillium riverlandense TaxID=1903569 RepID=UPI00254834C7|nr:uncharacterized protein N7474_003370 [Penicillium riverlandense]KAJ5826232.1 hypothetical protein N7474_003370 [Penicillium riverlandense]
MKPLLWRLVSALGKHSLVCVATYIFLVVICKDDMKVQNIILPQLLLAVHNALSTDSYNKTHPDAITAQRSRARRHLQSQGTGSWSTYPGLAMFLVYMLLSSLINLPAKLWFHDERIEFPVRIIWGILLTNLHTAWVHVVISKPSTKPSWQRILGWREWIEILPAASLDIILPSLVYHLVKIPLELVYDSHFFGTIGDMESTDYIQIVSMLPLALAYLTSLATQAIYIRVAASMLPSEDEPLVPFDRSFGGQARNSQTYSLRIKDARTGKAQNSIRYLNMVWGTLGREVICLAGAVIALAAELVFWSPCTVVGLAHLAFAQAS